MEQAEIIDTFWTYQRISRLGFVTPIVGEAVSLGPLGNAHHLRLASIATNELVAG